MKFRLLLLVSLFAISTFNSFAQRCPEYMRLLKQADSLARLDSFILALNKYNSAQTHCKDSVEAVQRKIKEMFLQINALKLKATNKAIEAKRALDVANRMIQNFDFYENKIAMATRKSENGDKLYYFMDRAGKKINTLGEWESAKLFDELGLARVSTTIDKRQHKYLLDTLGNKYLLYSKRVYISLYEDTEDTDPDTDNFDSDIGAIEMSLMRSKSDTAFWKNLLSSKKLVYLKSLRRDNSPTRSNLSKPPIPFDAIIDSLAELKYLFLSDCNIDKIPANIDRLKNLAYLDLSLNTITELPPQVTTLRKLVWLDLRYNDNLDYKQAYRVLPAGRPILFTTSINDKPSKDTLMVLVSGRGVVDMVTIAPASQTRQLRKMKALALENQKLTVLPSQIENLTDIVSLDASQNNLSALPIEIAHLNKLRLLNLNTNPKLDIPQAITVLSKFPLPISFTTNNSTEDPEDIDMDAELPFDKGLAEMPFLEVQIDQSMVLQCLMLANPSQVEMLQKTRTLKFTDNGLTAIPGKVSELKHLRVLNLENNKLETLGSFTFPDSLTSLNLSGNQLKQFPEQISRLQLLQTLDLKKNKLTEIPAGIASPSLSNLYLSDNQLSILPPQFSDMTRLRNLHLQKNNFATFPLPITKLNALQNLYLGNNLISSLPAEITAMTGLKALYLDTNRISEFPLQIAGLETLTSLHLNGNQLSKLPPEIYKMIQLATLNLSSNRFTDIPESLTTVQSLRVLYLGNNMISNVSPAISELQNLSSLYLSGNQIQVLPQQIGSLKKLNYLFVSDNLLTSLPSEIANLKALVTLNLGCNRLTEFPLQVTQLKNLQNLDVKDNKLTSLPASIDSLFYLSELNLDNNSFTEFPLQITALNNLKILKLRGNPITSIPPEIARLKTLRFLYLSAKNFSDQEKKRIQQLLPSCAVSFE